MPHGNSISCTVALSVIQGVQVLGKPVAQLYELVGLDPSAPARPERHLAAERYVALWQRVLDLAQSPAFAVRIGSAFDLESLEVFGFLAMSCQTLREAYVRTTRVRSFYNVGSSWELEKRGDGLRMVWVPWRMEGGSDLGWRGVNEFEVAEMLASIRRLSKEHLIPRRVCFRHSAPPDLTQYRELLGCTPDFGAEFDGFEADAAWLGKKVRTDNSGLREYYERQCSLAVKAFAGEPEFTQKVRQRLVASLGGELPTMPKLASSFGLSARSLHRRLKNEGTSYNDLLDEVRHKLAEGYLCRPKLGVGEVGCLLGFKDSSAFFKAFRRWTGMTPSEYRASRLIGALRATEATRRTTPNG
jgi:AraC-like DNA-binding protein